MNENKALIIAEAGVNHNGEINKALELVDVAENVVLILLNFKLLRQRFNP